MVVIAPFCEMVCKFQAWSIGVCVLEVDDYELLVLVCGEEERRFTGGLDTEDVAVLCLSLLVIVKEYLGLASLHHYEQRQDDLGRSSCRRTDLQATCGNSLLHS